MGYPETGLEVWAYPLQLVSSYALRFHESGRIEPFEGRLLLSRIEATPSEIVRIYNGPDFVVREHLFVPLNAPAAIITYEVEGRPDIQIEARFEPSLNLMWPGALGGQDIAWSDARSGYVEHEPIHGFAAVIRSAQAIAHDNIVNQATNRPSALGLVMEPRRGIDGVRRAELVVAEDEAQGKAAIDDPDKSSELRSEVAAHFRSILDQATEVTTPDEAVNRALAASIVALEQAWVCAPQIGCGSVAGYGPSRPGRRPQYAWFFAGDGLIAVEALLAAGRYERARDELEFIAKYQNKANGMIWHEMSTSAPLIDWEKRYPYMYVHVDITLQYLSTLADYVRTTGDTRFLTTHWAGVEEAWRYALSLVDRKTGLPSIPVGKEGQNEQAVLRDDVHLSGAWIDAANAFAELAKVEGKTKLALDGGRAAEVARQSVLKNYWDEKSGLWFAGHTLSGAPVHEERPDAVDILLEGGFDPGQAKRALDRLATPEFVTDWGVRSLSVNNPDFDPNAYASGAVWGLGSSGVATVFWKEHRPFTAWSAWHGLTSWATLDSPGHMHEVLAGDLFHPEVESVPEQTWSSAGFFSAAVHGLLGLEVRGASGAIEFAPHLPGNWGSVAIRRVRVGSSSVDLHMTEDSGSISLTVANRGPAVTVEFEPETPLGARVLGGEKNGTSIVPAVTQTAEDQHARVVISAPTGTTHVVVHYSGGVRLAPVETAPLVGDSSQNVKLVSAALIGSSALKLKAYVTDSDHAEIDLFTPMKIVSAEGAVVSDLGAGRARLRFHVPAN
ncbi:MAG TPA: hypothetical protein VE968_09960, partial [Sphingomicrobium sp.]|nr:hypothetical protein [Sphingomicrobium sp.]